MSVRKRLRNLPSVTVVARRRQGAKGRRRTGIWGKELNGPNHATRLYRDTVQYVGKE